MNGFLQTPPRLPDAWSSDRMLQESLRFYLGDELFDSAGRELAAIGTIATAPETLALAAKAEREPPVHVLYSTWGERIDEIRVSDAYLALGRVGVEAGVTALPYEDTTYGDRARLVWAGLIVLWSPSSAFYSCPVAMTDAAARTLLEHGDVDDMTVVQRLTTRDPNEAWTSGQWMTETAGGSDVSRTGTVATRDSMGRWRLHGTKWFTSATTSEMALTLARPEGAPGLGLFRVHRRLDDGSANGIIVRRLKDKLGTRPLPTAELELAGAVAYPVGDPLDGGGVRRISTMLNVTRVHNSLGAAATLARGLGWARAHARVREVFGRPLVEWPAHRATLADLAVDYAATLTLTMRCCELTGKAEHGNASGAERALLRGLTPVTKLATAKWAVAGAAEVMEAIGGVGYCEDSGIPTMVRDAHVLPIWEGTTNVLSLDLLRAAAKSDAINLVLEDAEARVGRVADEPLVAGTREAVITAIEALRDRAGRLAAEPVEGQAEARSLALSLAKTYACSLLCAQGAWAAARADARTAATAARLAQRGLVDPVAPDRTALALGMDEELAPGVEFTS